MNLELAGKSFIVTGGTDGLGLATVQILPAEGANVLVSSRSEGKLADLRAACGRDQNRGLCCILGASSVPLKV